jgi:hypothetical protein
LSGSESLLICEGVGSGRQHRAKVEGVHRTMSLVQQTPPYGVRCGDPRNRREREKRNESQVGSLVAGPQDYDSFLNRFTPRHATKPGPLHTTTIFRGTWRIIDPFRYKNYRERLFLGVLRTGDVNNIARLI